MKLSLELSLELSPIYLPCWSFIFHFLCPFSHFSLYSTPLATRSCFRREFQNLSLEISVYLNFSPGVFIVLMPWDTALDDVNHLHPSMNKFICFSPAHRSIFLEWVKEERDRETGRENEREKEREEQGEGGSERQNMKIMDLGEGCHQVGKMAKEWGRLKTLNMNFIYFTVLLRTECCLHLKKRIQLALQTCLQTTWNGQREMGVIMLKK